MELRLDDLQLKGLKIYQDPKAFCFGIDAVLLANHVRLKKKERVMDLGTGNGIIPLLLAGKSETVFIEGLEIQEELGALARKSVALNGLDKRITIHIKDLRKAGEDFPKSSYDVVVTNPPYMHTRGMVNPHKKKALARHEVACSLEEVIKAGKDLLRTHGRFYMVHRPGRLAEIFYYMKTHDLEPKKMTLIHPKAGTPPNLLIIEGRKGGSPELIVEKPLIIYRDNGEYTKEVLDLYQLQNLERG